MRTVAFISPLAAYEELKAQIDEAVDQVLRGGQYILGPQLDAFEANWAQYCGAKHAVGVSDGLAALTLALRAIGTGVDDEVIVPANTFIATWLAVSECGAVPVPVDPDPGTGNISAEGVQAAITARTRAVIPVHLYGNPADLDGISIVAGSRGIPVIEDAAQAHGARFGGRRVGGHSALVCWSFYPSKNLGAIGDGGAVTTHDDALASRLRMFRNYGSTEKYVHQFRGVNSRLDPLQAAILDVKLPHLDAWNSRRARIASRYSERLAATPLELPRHAVGAESSWHLYVVRTPHRDALRKHLASVGVECLIHYPTPPHLQTAYAEMGFREGAFPVAERHAREVLSLPIGPHASMQDADYVCDAVLDFWQRPH